MIIDAMGHCVECNRYDHLDIDKKQIYLTCKQCGKVVQVCGSTPIARWQDEYHQHYPDKQKDFFGRLMWAATQPRG